jgi:hypothetical protein
MIQTVSNASPRQWWADDVKFQFSRIAHRAPTFAQPIAVRLIYVGCVSEGLVRRVVTFVTCFRGTRHAWTPDGVANVRRRERKPRPASRPPVERDWRVGMSGLKRIQAFNHGSRAIDDEPELIE